MRNIPAIAMVALIALAGCGDPVTKGDIWDMDAADVAAKCAHYLIGRPTSDPAQTVWIMCTQAAANDAKRPIVKVAQRVIRREGKNVFEPGAGKDLSPSMIARLERVE